MRDGIDGTILKRMTRIRGVLAALAGLLACSTAPRLGVTPGEEDVPQNTEGLLATSPAAFQPRRLSPSKPVDTPPPHLPEPEPSDGKAPTVGAAVAASSPPAQFPLKNPGREELGAKKPGSGPGKPGEIKRSTSPLLGAAGLGGMRVDARPGARPDAGSLGKAPEGSRYLSSAALPEHSIGRYGLPAEQFPEAATGPPSAEIGALPGASDIPDLATFNAEAINVLFFGNLDVASYRVQIATAPEFDTVVYDRVYDFVDSINLNDEYLLFGEGPKIPGMPVWVRQAAIDLLGFEQPFTPAKRYTLRAPRQAN